MIINVDFRPDVTAFITHLDNLVVQLEADSKLKYIASDSLKRAEKNLTPLRGLSKYMQSLYDKKGLSFLGNVKSDDVFLRVAELKKRGYTNMEIERIACDNHDIPRSYMKAIYGVRPSKKLGF